MYNTTAPSLFPLPKISIFVFSMEFFFFFFFFFFFWGSLKASLGDYQLVFDSVYNPKKTRLLKEAEVAGAIVVSGVEMFLRQAVGQFNLFTDGQQGENEIFCFSFCSSISNNLNSHGLLLFFSCFFCSLFFLNHVMMLI